MTRAIFIALLVCAASTLSATDLRLNECLSSNVHGIVDEDGDTPDWIEIHNSGPEYIFLLGYGLSDDEDDPFKWIFPDRWMGPNECLLIFASGKDRYGFELHSNFKLGSEGETIILSDPEDNQIDEWELGPMPLDHSVGRQPDNDGPWLYFDEPSPGEFNLGQGYPGFAEAPELSVEAGHKLGAFHLHIYDPNGDADLHYSRDGADPNTDHDRYTGPISVGQSSVIRAQAHHPDLLPSKIVTATYLFGESSNLPILSLATDPANLWDTDTGIYVLGDSYDPDWPFYGANFWENWERPAHLEFFESDGGFGFSQDLGIKIHGKWSRAQDQKSIRLHPRGGYGDSEIDYPIFPDLPFSSYHHLILRNAGNDWGKGHMRDALAQAISRNENLDSQAYRPALLFINGDYWGIHNIRERIDEDYLQQHYDVEEDELDILEGNQEIIAGDSQHYYDLLIYLETHDMSLPGNYEYVQTQMDMDNFATYNICEVFFGNGDWPGNNTRYWRPKTPDGKWRWFLFDLDISLGHRWAWDHMDLNSILWENPEQPWTNFIFRKLVDNAVFRRDFINRYADLLNTTFRPERTLPVFNSTRDPLISEIDRHMIRWDFLPSAWEENLSVIEEFLSERPAAELGNLHDRFYLGAPFTLSLDIDPPEKGCIRLTGTTIDSTFEGTYFVDNPIPITAEPAPGYAFSAWSDPTLPQEASIILEPTDNYSLTAIFVEDLSWMPLVINEINYHSASDFDPGDWVEIFNPWNQAVDMSGMTLLDEESEHAFVFPEDTLIEGRGFVVVCQNLANFENLFPNVESAIGDLNFGFNAGGDVVRLLDDQGELIDWVIYLDDDPWPPEPDGGGPTLEFIDPLLDNSQASSWAASAGHGTPGAMNSTLVTGMDEPALPPKPVLNAPWPNPFNPQIQIEFALDRRRAMRLTIHDISGREIIRLAQGQFDTGEHSLSWNGRDKRGQDVSSGLYLVRMAYDEDVQNRKIMLIR
jgi:hypothetical protein